MSRYIVPQELRSATKVNSFLDLYDFFFLIGWCGVFFLAKIFVNPMLEMPYMIFAGCAGITMTVRSRTNPGKRNWQAFFQLLFRDGKIYTPQ